MSREQLTGFFCLRRTLNGPIPLLALALNAVLGQQALRAKLQLDAVLAEAAEMMGTVRFGTGGLSGQVMDASDKRAGIAFSLSPSQQQGLKTFLAAASKAE